MGRNRVGSASVGPVGHCQFGTRVRASDAVSRRWSMARRSGRTSESWNRIRGSVAISWARRHTGTGGAWKIRHHGCVRRNKHKTPEDERYRPSPGPPVVSLFAFLKLADWHRTYRNSVQGGEPCPAAKKSPFPAGTAADSTAEPAAPVGGSFGRTSPAHSAGAQSNRRTATSGASKRQGGAS